MSGGHTQGRLSLGRHGAIVGGKTYEFANGSAQKQIAMVCAVEEDNGDQLGNARHFVACWNAFVGVPTETIEKNTQDPSWLERPEQEIADDLQRRNAELLAALKTIAALGVGEGDVCELIAKRARAAIALAEGAQP